MEHVASDDKSSSDRDFYKIISILSTEERTILTLKYIYDYKNADIAKVLDMNLNTVKSVIKRSVDKLK